MTIAEGLRSAAQRLSTSSGTARLDAELLMAHALEVSRSDLLLQYLSEPVPESFAALVERRLAHEPVAYILGKAEFYGRDFAVNPAVLIPRGDSETVLEMALEYVPQTGRVLDMGTGSGALLLTILAERETLTGIGVDASPAAVETAIQNAVDLSLTDRAEMRVADWTGRGWNEGLNNFDLVVCNPPYVETGAQLEPDVIQHEPASALFAGSDGLADYRIIIPQLGNLLTETGIAVLEIGRDQAETVAEIAQMSGFETELRYDLADRPRALRLCRQN
ncbi:MAG: peptide chain release factor N(5)-glutamine methyltransferase [Erythrobacter sp.]